MPALSALIWLLPRPAALRLLGCSGFAAGHEPSRDVEVTLVHQEIPSGSDSPLATQARSAQRPVFTRVGTELTMIKRRKRRQ
jgi:hypothetical protein